MDLADLKVILEKLSRFYLANEMSGSAFAWTAESLIGLTDYDDDSEPGLDNFRTALAHYTPLGGENLLDEVALRRVVQRLVDGFPA